jgi:hypothetical protein
MTSDDGLSLLNTDSPARNKGITLDSPADKDIAGVSRPQGSAYDLGAYEFIE